MGATPTKPTLAINPANREWARFQARMRRFWETRDPNDRADALAALARFKCAFQGIHGGVVIPFDREART